VQQESLFGRLYVRLAQHRRILLLATGLALALSVLLFSRIKVGENVQAMLPDAVGGPLGDFELLQQAPFARKIVLTLKDEAGLGPDVLAEAGAKFAAALDPALFVRVVTGPADLLQTAGGESAGPQFLEFFVRNLPNLLDEQDLDEVARSIEPGEIRSALAKASAALRGPESLVLKQFVRSDPLELRRLALRKLQHLNMAGRVRVHNGRFLSQDQKRALLIAETKIPMTDFGGAQRLADAFQTAKSVLPAGIAAEMLCGHLYTLANARVIQQDLPVLLSASGLGMLLLFLIFLPKRTALEIFFLPFFAVCIGGTVVGLFYAPVSGITLGFGAVLLGMASDYAIYVYAPLQRAASPPGVVLGQITRPLSFCFLTTLAGFAVLLASDLPGQRQMAVYSISGLSAAWLLSLTVLPQLVRPGAPKRGASRLMGLLDRAGRACRRRYALTIALWGVLLLVSGLLASRVRVNGDLRALGVIPAELRQAEAELRETWGEMRGQALLFASGLDLESALQTNDAVFSFMRRKFPEAPVISLAPILPSAATQDRNRRRWDAFWEENRERTRAVIERISPEFGFSKQAFAPFFTSMDASIPDIGPDELRAVGLGEILDTLLPAQPGHGSEQASEQAEGVARVLTLAPDQTEILDAFSAPPSEGEELDVTALTLSPRADNAPPPLAAHDVRPVSQSRFAAELSRALSKDFVFFVSATSALVLALLVFMLRRPKKILIALAPAASGLLVLGGVMGATGMPLTIYNILASVLIISSGVDYGIIMAQRLDKNYAHDTEFSVLLAGATTLAGFGVLVLARHPALSSIGVTVLLGMLTAILAALTLAPALYGTEKSETRP
jgi:predicted exporter